MIEDDNELRRLLGTWSAPPPSGSLDERVMRSVRFGKRQSTGWKLWGALAAAILLVAVLATASRFKQERQLEAGPNGVNSLSTTVSASGFVPLEEGRIIVSKTNGSDGVN